MIPKDLGGIFKESFNQTGTIKKYKIPNATCDSAIFKTIASYVVRIIM
jgi:hypothetical protein